MQETVAAVLNPLGIRMDMRDYRIQPRGHCFEQAEAGAIPSGRGQVNVVLSYDPGMDI